MPGFDGQFNARLQRLERMSGEGSGGGVPESSVSDAGKVLTVGQSGVPAWAEPSGGSGSGALIVHLTPIVDPDYASIADKTAREIINAIPLVYQIYETNDEHEFYPIVGYAGGESGYYISFGDHGTLFAETLDSYPKAIK